MEIVTPFHLERLTPVIGARVSGIDLRQVGPTEAAALRAALLEHLVLFFDGQDVDDEHHVRLARFFGEAQVSRYRVVEEGAPEVNVVDTVGQGVVTSSWHADHTFVARPPIGSIIRAIRLPESGGGDTCFASMYAAYDELSHGLKAMLDGMTAVHAPPDMKLADDGPALDLDPVIHPVIASHRETGRKLLNVNSAWTTRICELSEAESAWVLRILFEQVKRPEFQCRFRWEAGSIAFLDNHAVQHYAVKDYSGRRILRRVMIADTQPASPSAAVLTAANSS